MNFLHNKSQLKEEVYRENSLKGNTDIISPFPEAAFLFPAS